MGYSRVIPLKIPKAPLLLSCLVAANPKLYFVHFLQVMHHGHRGLECDGGGIDRSSAIATLCQRLAARVSSASQVRR